MKENAWISNEIACAYERNFILLEEARKEYAQTVSDFLTNLHQDVRTSANKSTSCEGVEAGCAIFGNEFNTGISVVLSVAGESAEQPAPSGITITARAAAPVGGNPGHLRIAASAASFNASTTRWNVELLRLEVTESLLPADSKTVRPAADEILAFEVSLERNGLAQVKDTIQYLISLLAPVAMKIVEDQRFTERMKQTLVVCAEKLSKNPPVKDGKIEEINWWGGGGMHYIQFNASDAPGFWVGYPVQNGCIMYGYNFSNNPPSSLAASFFDRMKATPPKNHGNFPAGTLLKSEDLRNKSTEEIEALVIAAFRDFYSLIAELRADSASRSNPASS